MGNSSFIRVADLAGVARRWRAEVTELRQAAAMSRPHVALRICGDAALIERCAREIEVLTGQSTGCG